MAQLILLGTGSALSGPTRENTFMVVRGDSTNLLIDCAGSPTQRLAHVGVNASEIDHILLTHNHPDHIYGFPLLMLNAWMAGRVKPLHVYGVPETVRSARALLNAVDAKLWPNFFKIKYHTIIPNSMTTLPTIGEFDVAVAPTVHYVPTLAVRVTERATGKNFAYSADTAPHPNIVEIARDANYLLHEATTLDESSVGHSSAVEAGKHAAEAHVKELILLHLPPNVSPQKWRDAARQSFHGKVVVAKDFDSFKF